MASGKAATLRIWSSVIAVSAVCCLRSVRRSNTISKAIQNSSSPPAMRKAGSETPSAFSTTSPATPKKPMMQKAMIEARTATCRRSPADMPRVSDRKIGARPGGSSVTSIVTRAEVANSTNMRRDLTTAFARRHPRRKAGLWQRLWTAFQTARNALISLVLFLPGQGPLLLARNAGIG